MAITIQHQPDLGMLASAGYVAGAGEFRRHQEEMAQRERMQERAIQAQLYEQQLQQANYLERQAMENEARAQMYGMQSQASVDRAQMNAWNQQQLARQREEAQRGLFDLNKDHRVDMAERQFRQQREMEILRNANADEADQAKFLFGQADDAMDGIRKLLTEGNTFANEQEQHKYDVVASEIEKIYADPSINAIQKAQAVFKLANSIPIPRVKPPTNEAVIKDRVAYVDDPNRPGVKMPVAMDRNGSPGMVRGYKPPEDATVDEQGANLPLSQRIFKDPELRLKYWAAAEKSLTTKGGPDAPEVKPSADAIIKRMREMAEAAEPQSQKSNGKKPKELTYDRRTGQWIQ